MTWYVIALVLGLAVGSGVTWLVVRKLPQDKIREINYAKLEEEQQLFGQQKDRLEEEIRHTQDWLKYERIEQDNMRKDRDDLIQSIMDKQKEAAEYERRCDLLGQQYDHLTGMVVELNNKRLGMERDIENEKRKAEETARAFLKQSLELAQEQLDRALEAAAQKYQADEEAYRLAYLSTVHEAADGLNETLADYQTRIVIAAEELGTLQANIDALVENAKREELKRQEANFYRLVLSDKDLEEIKMLRTVEPCLKDKEALNKVIWKVYYEKPYTDLVGRVLGPNVVTGIYKITNLENGMCYVGQSVNMADRWRQHIKRGVGAEAPTRNKLYPAMQEFGVENFSFELLEQCDKASLDAREDAFQQMLHTKDFGYSIK